MKQTARQNRLRNQHFRDTATYTDPLSLPKLKELLALWKERYRTHDYPDDTCRNMIRMYERRIGRLEANTVAGADPKTL
jgi:hypothetical protein